MTTYSSVLATYTNAGTTAALKDLMNSVATLFTNAGFAKSTETGEIDINAVTYSATSGTNYGFQVWYLNDSQHSTYPIYVRIYWRMSAASTIGLGFTVGHATDGAGNITGYKYGSDTNYVFASNTWGTAGNASKACTIDGYGFWALCPSSAASANMPLFILTREWDNSTGAVATGGNYSIVWRPTTTYHQIMSMNRADSLVSSAITALGTIPNGLTSSLRGAYTDIFKVYQAYPNIGYRVSGSMCLYNATEISQWATFSCNIHAGGSARTWIATGASHLVAASETSHLAAVLWE